MNEIRSVEPRCVQCARAPAGVEHRVKQKSDCGVDNVVVLFQKVGEVDCKCNEYEVKEQLLPLNLCLRSAFVEY